MSVGSEMSARRLPLLVLPLLALLCAGGEAQQDKNKKKGKEPAPTGVSYARQVYPIVKDRCQNCHYAKDKKGGLDVSTYAALMKGGKNPNNIVPGAPEKSLFVKEIVGKEPSMPKNALPLTMEQIDLIVLWIREGARNN